MSCLAAVAVAAISASNCPTGSYWQLLLTTKALEQFCPAEVSKPMSGPMGTRYDAAIAVARKREVEFTARNRQELTLGQIEAEFTAYEARIRAQTAEGFKAIGCPEMARRLGLAIPSLAVTPEAALQIAGMVQLPSTARGSNIPEHDRNGTMMGYALQVTMKRVLQRQYKCEPESFKVTILTREERQANDPPPFVKPILDVTEMWKGSCNGAPAEFKVKFHQDQRKWFSYMIESAPPAAEATVLPATPPTAAKEQSPTAPASPPANPGKKTGSDNVKTRPSFIQLN